MSTPGERKCALLLVTLHRRDRRRLLNQLPPMAAKGIRTLVAKLESLPIPVSDLAENVLADEVAGLTLQTTPGLEQLVALSHRMSPAWFARVLPVWGGLDRAFCLAMLDDRFARAVRGEENAVAAFPAKLVDAMRAEILVLVQQAEAA